MNKFFFTLFDYSSYPEIAPDEREKRRIAVILFLIMTMVIIPVAIYNYYTGRIAIAVINMAVCFLMLLFFLVMKRVRDAKKVFRAGALLFAGLFLCNLYIGGRQASLAMWAFIFPLGTFFMFGEIEGFAWNMVFLLFSVSLMLLSHHVSGIYHYSYFFIVRFSLIYISISTLTMGYEKARASTLRALIEKQNSLRINYNQMKLELELSKKIQKNIIPARPPEFEGLRIASLYKPLGEVGGDFYDYVLMAKPAKLGVFISDVSGHGVTSALITSMIKILISTSGRHRENTSEMLFYMNKHLYEKSGGYLTTAFYCIFDPGNMTLSYSRGGHSFPFFIRNGKVERLVTEGYILGAKKSPIFETKKINLQRGDKILLYTDGLTETAGSCHGTFEGVIDEVLIKYSHRGANDLIKNVFSECQSFRGGDAFEDDISLIAIEITGTEPG